MKMPPQVFRLILLAAGIVVSYSTARYCLTPASFGQYGWFRGQALVEAGAHEPVFAGRKACEECHSEQCKKLAEHGHKTLSCEACHGPAQAHAENPDVKLEKPQFGACVRCHEANPSRPKWHKQIVVKDHYTVSKCTECHLPHLPEESP
jgi:hypothetical protein